MRRCFHRQAAAATVALATAAASGVRAQAAPDDDGVRLRFSGFISASVFAQDALFSPGNGQNAQQLERVQDGPGGWWHGADVRNTRGTLEAHVASAGAWDVGGLMEFDLFGGFPSGGAFAREQAFIRLRIAFAEFDRGATRIRIGQDWAPITHDMPESINRLSFPPGWGAAAVIGWRFPGIFVRQALHDGTVQVHLEAAAMRGAWVGFDDDAQRPTAAQATLVPQLQAALALAAADGARIDWGFTAGVHADRKQARRAGDATHPADGWAVAASGRIAPAPFVLRAGGYTGRAVGHLAATASQVEDVRGTGGWAQLGAGMGDAWGVRLFGGIDAMREADILALDEGVFENRTVTLELRHEPGPWGVALEWQHTRTDWWHAPSAERSARRGNQAALGAVVRF
jgi:hypothetical protein